ncbi:MAG: HepT-like ribonuclease domain-containing protein [Fibrobacterota bacterium]
MEIIGEAARNIPESLQIKHPDIPWKDMIGMRNKIAHAYFGIQWLVVWKIEVSLGNNSTRIIDHFKKLQSVYNDRLYNGTPKPIHSTKVA